MKFFRRWILKYLPIKKNKIVFTTMNEAYGCNPKYICDEIIRRKLPYDLVWVSKLSKEEGHFPPEVRLVARGKDAQYERATCRIMICNAFTNYFQKGFKKKSDQTYIQTWHGSYGIKKMEADCPDKLPPEYIKLAKADSAQIDCLLSCGSWATGIFKNALFSPPKHIVETGLPRNDVFFSSSTEFKTKVRQVYNLAPDTNIALYAPTFRNDSQLNQCQLDYAQLRQALTTKFGGHWVIIVRLHPNIADLANQLSYHSREIINGTSYPDMQELLSASDLLISDYSSSMFDFLLSRRPCFIFATDIEQYNIGRGFYYPLEDTPFPIATSNNQLWENLRNFDIKSYVHKVEEFLKGKGACDDGSAAKRVVDYIESIMK